MKIFYKIIYSLLIIAVPLKANYKELFKQGKELVEKGEYDKAIEVLKMAVAQKEEPTAFVGGLLGYYVPYHYLGVAFAKKGECRKALLYFERSWEEGVVRKSGKLIAERNKLKSQCEKELEDNFRKKNEYFLASLEEAKRRVNSAKIKTQSPPFTAGWENPKSFDFGLYERKIDNLEKELLSLDKFSDLGSFEKKIDLLLKEINDLERAISREEERLKNIVDDKFGKGFKRILSVAEKDIKYIRNLEIFSEEEVKKMVEETEKIVDDAKNVDIYSLTPKEARDLRKRVIFKLTQLRNLVKKPEIPDTLKAAVELFVNGDYFGVLEALKDIEYDNDIIEGHRCLLLSASYFYLGRLEGEKVDFANLPFFDSFDKKNNSFVDLKDGDTDDSTPDTQEENGSSLQEDNKVLSEDNAQDNKDNSDTSEKSSLELHQVDDLSSDKKYFYRSFLVLDECFKKGVEIPQPPEQLFSPVFVDFFFFVADRFEE